ncbi:MAG: transposase [Succinivibrio sp.]|nr:transposase [Succinivibrio sp.]
MPRPSAPVPDYVANFEKPAGTEIKHIKDYYYLYECTSKYDKELGRSRKVSGKLLGRITPQGLIRSRARRVESGEIAAPPVIAHLPRSVLECGASLFFLKRSEGMRQMLEHHFPDLWQYLHALAILRTVYGGRFRRLQLHFENSLLCHVYRNLSFEKETTREIIRELGGRRNHISDFMKESASGRERFILFDGHRVLSSSRTMEDAELGYDSKRRYKPQLNVLYAFSLDEEGTGMPSYYKQYAGGTPDVSAFRDLLNEYGLNGENITVIGDKGTASEEGIEELLSSGLKYILPLRRGNLETKDCMPQSHADYDNAFTFNGRSIQSKTWHHDGYDIHLFLDNSLFAEEMADATRRRENSNTSIESRARAERQRRAQGKGRLTDEQLSKLVAAPMSELITDLPYMGTITVKSNRTELTDRQVYCLLKQRQAIEQFFKTYDDTLDFDSSYMRSRSDEEAWLFLNHLSAMLGIAVIEELMQLELSKDISLKDLTASLLKISVSTDGTSWSVSPIKKKVRGICEILGYNVNNAMVGEVADPTLDDDQRGS